MNLHLKIISISQFSWVDRELTQLLTGPGWQNEMYIWKIRSSLREFEARMNSVCECMCVLGVPNDEGVPFKCMSVFNVITLQPSSSLLQIG